MRVFSRQSFQKSEAGSILMQVLLGIGLMVAMSPLVFTQIKKYNDGILREEIIAQMENLQRAVTSFVMFEKTKMVDGEEEGQKVYFIPDEQVKVWRGSELQHALKDYVGTENTPVKNRLGQEYSFITSRKGDSIEAVVVASGGGVDELELNTIGQYLFDKGVVVGYDGVVLSKLGLSDKILHPIQQLIHGTDSGALVMFVSDVFFSSDFLHLDLMPGELNSRTLMYNTMSQDLNMDKHDVINVENLYSMKLTATGVSNIGLLSFNKMNIRTPLAVEKIEYKNVKGIEDSGNQLRLSTQFVHVANMGVKKAKFDRIDIKVADLETGNLRANKYKISGNVNVTGSPLTDTDKVSIEELNAYLLSSGGDRPNTIKNITMTDSGAARDSFIYVGGGEDGNVVPLVLNLSGTSEVDDICLRATNENLAGCTTYLSTRVIAIHTKLLEILTKYLDYMEAKEAAAAAAAGGGSGSGS